MRRPIKEGCYCIAQASKILGIPQKHLWQKLRAFGWLYVGTYPNDPHHNTARRPALLAGYLTTEVRGYPAPYNKNVTLLYSVILITQRGLDRLKDLINEPIAQVPATEIFKNEDIKRHRYSVHKTASEKADEHSEEQEHEKAIAQLREWGLYAK